MTWLVWRQYRVQAAIAAGLLAAFAVVLLVTGVQMASQWHSALIACTADHSLQFAGAPPCPWATMRRMT